MKHRIAYQNSVDLVLIIVSYFALGKVAGYINSFAANIFLGPFSLTQCLFIGIILLCSIDILGNVIFIARNPKDKFHRNVSHARHGQWANMNRRLQTKFKSKSSGVNQIFWKNAEQIYLQLVEKYPLPTVPEAKILAATIENSIMNPSHATETKMKINSPRPETGEDLMTLTIYNKRSFIIAGLMVLIMIGVWAITTYIPVSQ